MLLEALEIQNFRNLEGKVIFRDGLNIIYGENGQGKTNWLEAIYVLANTKSFKTTKLQEAIRFETDEIAFIRGSVRQSAEIERIIQVTLEGNTKTLSINGKKETLNRYAGQLHALIFNAEELETVRGTPEHRRKFLDAGIVGVYPPFVKTLADYAKVIKQKNALLQNARDNELSLDKVSKMLEVWNDQLITIATRIHKARVRYVERLNEVFARHLFSKEEISIRYASSLEEKGDISDYSALLSERLDLRVQAEFSAGYSLIGTHRDDLEILFDNRDLRKFGSSGQQRSAFLLMQLAIISVYETQNGEYPIYLIDDIDSELDYRRIGQLLEFLQGKTQTFVTTSKESFVKNFSFTNNIFLVINGEINSNS
jgi:DNA replication and repair protein RecF